MMMNFSLAGCSGTDGGAFRVAASIPRHLSYAKRSQPLHLYCVRQFRLPSGLPVVTVYLMRADGVPGCRHIRIVYRDGRGEMVKSTHFSKAKLLAEYAPCTSDVFCNHGAASMGMVSRTAGLSRSHSPPDVVSCRRLMDFLMSAGPLVLLLVCASDNRGDE